MQSASQDLCMVEVCSLPELNLYSWKIMCQKQTLFLWKDRGSMLNSELNRTVVVIQNMKLYTIATLHIGNSPLLLKEACSSKRLLFTHCFH